MSTHDLAIGDTPTTPYQTYTGADGADHRSMVVTEPPKQYLVGMERAVTVTILPLGGEHDYNALLREVIGAVHYIAMQRGDVTVERRITFTVSETVQRLR